MTDESPIGAPDEKATPPSPVGRPSQPPTKPPNAAAAAATSAHSDDADHDPGVWPGRPVIQTSGWRQIVLTRLATLELELRQAQCTHDSSDCEFRAAREQILRLMETAQSAAESKAHWGTLKYSRGGVPDAAWLAIHAAEEALLPHQDNATLRGKAPTIIAWGRMTLGQDPRVSEVADLFKHPSTEPVDNTARQLLKALLRSANDKSDSSYVSSRNFRNLVVIAAGIAALIGVLIALLGLNWSDAAPLCEAQVCPVTDHLTPTGLDIIAVELYGVLGASLAGAFSLRQLRGTRNPYGIGLVQGLLKIPLGALTGFVGVLIVQSGLLAGIVKPTSSGQVLAYAVVFGYSQQLLTSLVDKQAQRVVHGTSGERTTTGAAGSSAK